MIVLSVFKRQNSIKRTRRYALTEDVLMVFVASDMILAKKRRHVEKSSAEKKEPRDFYILFNKRIIIILNSINLLRYIFLLYSIEKLSPSGYSLLKIYFGFIILLYYRNRIFFSFSSLVLFSLSPL